MANSTSRFDAATTALVLIDLQNGILGRPLEPHSAADVLEAGKALAAKFREAGAPVVLVNVGWSVDLKDLPPGTVEQPISLPEGGLPPGWADLVDGLAQPGDLRIAKRQWGAFYGTDLDLQLRRRGIKTIVLGGVATNFGVESTARSAHEHGYSVVFAEDAMTSMSAVLHATAVEHILPRIGIIAQSAEISLTAGLASRDE
ncbi:MAG TPA: hydrolase [Devosiaceae bacterium]|nr:hydrolase [Devosiaceae bacterium]